MSESSQFNRRAYFETNTDSKSSSAAHPAKISKYDQIPQKTNPTHVPCSSYEKPFSKPYSHGSVITKHTDVNIRSTQLDTSHTYAESTRKTVHYLDGMLDTSKSLLEDSFTDPHLASALRKMHNTTGGNTATFTSLRFPQTPSVPNFKCSSGSNLQDCSAPNKYQPILDSIQTTPKKIVNQNIITYSVPNSNPPNVSDNAHPSSSSQNQNTLSKPVYSNATAACNPPHSSSSKALPSNIPSQNVAKLNTSLHDNQNQFKNPVVPKIVSPINAVNPVSSQTLKPVPQQHIPPTPAPMVPNMEPIVVNNKQYLKLTLLGKGGSSHVYEVSISVIVYIYV